MSQDKIHKIIQKAKQKGESDEIAVQHECYLRVTHDMWGYHVNLSPYWPIPDGVDVGEDSLSEEQVLEFLSELDI